MLGAGYSPYETKVPNTEVEARPVSTEVMMVNGQPVVRPTSLPLGHSNGDSSIVDGGDLVAAGPAQSHHNHLGVAEVGIAKLQTAPVHGGQPVYVKQKSHSNVDLSPTAAQMAVDIQPYTRPRSINSLPHTINAPTRNMLHNDTHSGSARQAERAASQSPQKNERYSWCSDNLTSNNPSNGLLLPENSDDSQSAYSLQQFGNVNSDTNAVHAADYRC